MVRPARRLAYARHVLGLTGLSDERLEAAFATVPREAFAGPPPWRMVALEGLCAGLPRQTSKPEDLYCDSLIQLEPTRGVNNGSPSLHAQLLNELAPRPGEAVAHIGAGGGYYSAIIAELVGPRGRVIAVEYGEALAAAAKESLQPWPQVEVLCADGALYPREEVDGVYVSVAAAAPAAPWLDCLRLGGRLVFPLGVPGRVRAGFRSSDTAVMLWVERRAGGFAARSLMPVSFVFAESGLGQVEEAEGLAAAFAGRGLSEVKSLRWGDPGDPARAWFWSPRWSLSYDPPPDD